MNSGENSLVWGAVLMLIVIPLAGISCVVASWYLKKRGKSPVGRTILLVLGIILLLYISTSFVFFVTATRPQ